MSSDRTPDMSAPNKTPRKKTPRAKPAKPKPRRREPQAEASIPLAELGARGSKKARAPKIEINSELLAHAHVSKAWPFEEARKVLSRLKRIPKPTGAIIFETG